MKQIRLFALVLVLATVAAYSNAFFLPFVFDDQITVVENPSIRTLSPLSQVLSAPAQSSTAGRPLVNLSFALNYAVHGISPFGYHVVNLTMHVLCGLLLFGIVRRTIALAAAAPVEVTPMALPAAKKRKPSMRASEKTGPAESAAAISWPGADRLPPLQVAFTSALFWLLHPLQTETINYVTQRTESMMALAYLATFYAFIRGLRSQSPGRWHAGAVAACATGMLCKESMATAPVTLLLFDAAFLSAGLMPAVKARPKFYAALAATWLVLAVVNISTPRSNSAGFSTDVGVLTYLLNQGPIILRYFWLTVAPIKLIFDYGLPQPIALSDALPACTIVGALFLGSVALWRREPRLGFLALWVFVTLAPASSIVPIATEVGAERRMYLPLASLAVLAAVLLHRIVTERRTAVIAATAIATVFAALTFARNGDYADPMRLWQTVLDRYPHGRAHYSRGMLLKDIGQTEASYREMEIAAKDFPDAEYAIGFELSMRGRHEEAIAALRRYVAAQPLALNVLRAFNLMGQAHLAMNQPEAAAAAFRETLQRQPGNVDALGGLGDSLVRLQRYDEAITAYQSFLRTTTNRAPAYFNLGMSLAARQRYTEAIGAFRAALAIAPNDPATHANLAEALGRSGNIDGAIAEFERVMALDRDPDVRRDIVQMIAQLRAAR